VNPGTAGGGSTTERRDFDLMASSVDFDRFKNRLLSLSFADLRFDQLQVDKTQHSTLVQSDTC